MVWLPILREATGKLYKNVTIVAQFDESPNKVCRRGHMELHLRYMDEEGIAQTSTYHLHFLVEPLLRIYLRR